MPNLKEQQIVDAVIARMENIRVTNGYQTDIGANVADSETQWDQEDDINEFGALSVFQGTTTTPDDDAKSALVIRLLPIILQATFKRGQTSAASAALGRKVTADIYKAIGTDTRWTVSNVALAMLTRERSHGPEYAKDTFEITGVQIEIEIQYMSTRFSLEA